MPKIGRVCGLCDSNMRHDWIFDVLIDLRIYAQENGLEKICRQTDQLIDVARQELTEKSETNDGRSDGCNLPR